MKTSIKKNKETIVVDMQGRLDYETNLPLRDNLFRLIQETKTDTVPKKIILNLEKLEFVGSSGISAFVQMLKDFNASAPTKPLYCNVKSEFQKIIRAFDEEKQFEFSEDNAHPDRLTKKMYDN